MKGEIAGYLNDHMGIIEYKVSRDIYAGPSNIYLVKQTQAGWMGQSRYSTNKKSFYMDPTCRSCEHLLADKHFIRKPGTFLEEYFMTNSLFSIGLVMEELRKGVKYLGM